MPLGWRATPPTSSSLTVTGCLVIAQIDAELLKRYGLMAEAQYYFTNQWYMNAAYGVTAAMGIDQELIQAGNVAGVPLYSYNAPVQQIRSMQQVDATLWWRPIAALKFGVQYSYAHAQFLQDAYPDGTLPVRGDSAERS